MKLNLLFNQVVVAILIVLVGIILGKFAQRITLKTMQELEISYLLKKTTHIKVSLDNFVSNIIAYLIYLISFILAFNSLGLLFDVGVLILIGFTLILATGLFLFLISLAPNLCAKFKLRNEPIVEGKIIEVNKLKGKIKSISIGFIFLENGINIPYYYLLKNKFKIFN